MNRTPIVIAAVVIAALGAVVLGDRVSWLPWSKQARESRSVMATEVLVMRTPGGLLEVSRIEATERFDKTFIYSVLGAEVGETTAYIRVPAVYRYHIELAPEWRVERTGDTFRVVTPPIRPTLPVAVHQGAVAMQHLAHLVLIEKDVGAAVIGNQEAVAVLMALNLARRQAGALGQDVGALAVAHQLAFALHRPQPALEHLALAARDVE